MQNTTEDIEQLVRAMKAMLIINEKLHLILQGYSFSEVHRFNGFLDRMHFAESKPVKYAQVFKNVDPAIITKPKQYAKDAYRSLVLQNIDYRKFELQQILGATKYFYKN